MRTVLVHLSKSKYPVLCTPRMWHSAHHISTPECWKLDLLGKIHREYHHLLTSHINHSVRLGENLPITTNSAALLGDQEFLCVVTLNILKLIYSCVTPKIRWLQIQLCFIVCKVLLLLEGQRIRETGQKPMYLLWIFNSPAMVWRVGPRKSIFG